MWSQAMKKIFWIGTAIIVAISFGITFFAPINDIFKGIAYLPGVAGLASALFQLLRDSAAHQRKLEIQKEQQLFNLGATSHMANSVFDKHVEFCEKYLMEVHQTVVTLTREGPTKKALDHTGNLHSLRIEYTAWITPEIEKKLMPFEKAVKDIGAKSWFIDALKGEVDQKEQRIKAIEEMYDIFRNLMKMGEPKVKDEDATVTEVKNRVREILQVNQLVDIREYLINRAAYSAANKAISADAKSRAPE